MRSASPPASSACRSVLWPRSFSAPSSSGSFVSPSPASQALGPTGSATLSPSLTPCTRSTALVLPTLFEKSTRRVQRPTIAPPRRNWPSSSTARPSNRARLRNRARRPMEQARATANRRAVVRPSRTCTGTANARCRPLPTASRTNWCSSRAIAPGSRSPHAAITCWWTSAASI